MKDLLQFNDGSFSATMIFAQTAQTCSKTLLLKPKQPRLNTTKAAAPAKKMVLLRYKATRDCRCLLVKPKGRNSI